jgi:hypothetical protein
LIIGDDLHSTRLHNVNSTQIDDPKHASTSILSFPHRPKEISVGVHQQREEISGAEPRVYLAMGSRSPQETNLLRNLLIDLALIRFGGVRN